jgi:hypothetical protein
VDMGFARAKLGRACPVKPESEKMNHKRIRLAGERSKESVIASRERHNQQYDPVWVSVGEATLSHARRRPFF